MIYFAFIIWLLFISYYFSSIGSENVIQSILMPVIFVLSLLALVIWLFIRLWRHMKGGGLNDVADSGIISYIFRSSFGRDGGRDD